MTSPPDPTPPTTTVPERQARDADREAPDDGPLESIGRAITQPMRDAAAPDEPPGAGARPDAPSRPLP